MTIGKLMMKTLAGVVIGVVVLVLVGKLTNLAKCREGYKNVLGTCWASCPKNSVDVLALCRERCRSGYKDVAGVCWEKCNGVDVGALCRERCREGYKDKAGVCWKGCNAGDKDVGLVCRERCRSGYNEPGGLGVCWKGIKSYLPKTYGKSSYIPKTTTKKTYIPKTSTKKSYVNTFGMVAGPMIFIILVMLAFTALKAYVAAKAGNIVGVASQALLPSLATTSTPVPFGPSTSPIPKALTPPTPIPFAPSAA